MQQQRHPLRDGALSGLLAALVMIATGLLIRWLAGVGTIAELASDRIAPLTGIPLFFKLLSLLRGYSHLKQLGVISALLAQFVGGALVGVLYAKLRATRVETFARLVAASAVTLILLFTIVGLWPNLGTNYDGLPPTQATVASIVKLLFVTALFIVVLFWAYELLRDNEEHLSSQGNPRRSFLLLGGASTLAALVTAALLTRFHKIATYAYDGTENSGGDLPPITPNDRFYQVTKNNVDPRPRVDLWGLEVSGKVSMPRIFRFADLKAMPVVTQETTLQCISNQVGGGLNSNAVWTGVMLKDLLERAGVSPGARQVMFHGADGFTDDIPFDKAMHPQTLLVFEMNGQGLPQRHGYPVRLIVPGYVGEKSVKWITKVDVLDQPQKGFYEQQGWGPQFTINNSSRFDAPDFDEPVSIGGAVMLKGTAFAGDRGVRQVQVSTDGEQTWRDAQITYRGSDLAWVQWRLSWKPDHIGDYKLAVRCVDNKGGVQSGEMKGPAPEPAQGYHRVDVVVKA